MRIFYLDNTEYHTITNGKEISQGLVIFKWISIHNVKF